MRTRTAIRRDHRGSRLAETLYVRTPSGVVLLAGVHAAQRVQREAEISDALALGARRKREIQEARDLHTALRDAGPYTRRAHVHVRGAEREVVRLEALPPVHVPEPLPAVSVYAPPLVRDKCTARAAARPAGPAGTREEYRRWLHTRRALRGVRQRVSTILAEVRS